MSVKANTMDTVNLSEDNCGLFKDVKSSVSGMKELVVTEKRKKLTVDNQIIIKGGERDFTVKHSDSRTYFSIKTDKDESSSIISMLLGYIVEHGKKLRDACPIKQKCNNCIVSMMIQVVKI